MSRKARNQPNADAINIDVEIENAAQTGQKSVAAFAHLHSRVFRDAMKFNAEMLDFARRRVGADIETSDRLTRCRSVADAMGVMTDFCQNALHDYTDHTTSIVRVGTAITSQNAEETIAEAAELNDTD